ncbi:hypothetical protein L3Q82_002754 [Scortum barcoo]|uniref:Uncharacterized protein n=1 Tax=Scortum barcoo TaxID=214431 RepID=A0ACB8VU46_9TELE|nr:hypothetical protein L3Q82_002754 [Scortum barcoo]
MRRQSYRPVAVELLEVWCLGHWGGDAGHLPEQELLLQAATHYAWRRKMTLRNAHRTSRLSFTGSEAAGADRWLLGLKESGDLIRTMKGGCLKSPPGSPSAAAFTHTDTGLYQLTCGGLSAEIHLNVLFGFDASVSEGGAVRLDCHYSTSGSHVDSVRWEKDGKVVLERSLSSGRTEGSEPRASFPRGRDRDGDWSLLLDAARLQDEGDYFCSVRYKGAREAWGEPAAVRLKVHKRDPDQTTPPSLLTDKPTEALNKPTEALNKPTETLNKPTETLNKPTDAFNKPTDQTVRSQQ